MPTERHDTPPRSPPGCCASRRPLQHPPVRRRIPRRVGITITIRIMTGTTTILSTFAIYIVAGEAVRSFAFVLGAGIIIGVNLCRVVPFR